MKYNSKKELIPYELAKYLGFDHLTEARLVGSDLYLSNFTSTEVMLETLEQSGLVGNEQNPQEVAVELFKKKAVVLFVLDYLVEHDDRHWGNLGYSRDANTGEYLGMAYYYDFDWAWSDGVIPLPQNAIKTYSSYIIDLCKKALEVSFNFEEVYKKVLDRRSVELLDLVSKSNMSDNSRLLAPLEIV